MERNANVHEQCKTVLAIPPGADGGAGDYVSLANYDRCAVILTVDNGTTVTAGAVTLKQATAVAGTGEKALAFSRMRANVDTGASDALVETAVTSNTFNTDGTNDKNQLYVIDVKATDLDIESGFDCMRVDVAAAINNAVVGAVYVLWPARHRTGGQGPSAIVD